MTGQKSRGLNQNRILRVLPLVLIGFGLIILGVAGFILWPSPQDGGSAESAETDHLNSSIPVAVDFPAPELAVERLDGTPVSLDDYRGRVILVNNWATWCPPCKAEMPTLQAFYEAHEKQGFLIVAIDAGDAIADVERFVQEYGLTFDVLVDPGMTAMQAFSNYGLPSSYLIDESGTVRLAWTGAISRDMLETHITPLLEE